jgi:hypothetical protein
MPTIIMSSIILYSHLDTLCVSYIAARDNLEDARIDLEESRESADDLESQLEALDLVDKRRKELTIAVNALRSYLNTTQSRPLVSHGMFVEVPPETIKNETQDSADPSAKE